MVMERNDALRIFGQLIETGYACQLRATNVNEKSGPQYEVGVAMGYCPIGKVRAIQDIADSNAADTYIADQRDHIGGLYLVLSSPKRRPELYEQEASDG